MRRDGDDDFAAIEGRMRLGFQGLSPHWRTREMEER